MIQENKDLLLKYLCAALPYKVIIEYNNDGCAETREMGLGSLHDFMFDNAEIKPYLRSMLSMTEEERIYKENYFKYDFLSWDYVDWLNSHHFDYRGLIEKGLALEAPKDMYNIK